MNGIDNRISPKLSALEKKYNRREPKENKLSSHHLSMLSLLSLNYHSGMKDMHDMTKT